MAHGTRFTQKQLEQMAADFDRGQVETDARSEEVIETDTSEGTATMTIRLPRSVISAMKSAAEDEGIGATVLARRWIMDRLDSGAMDVPTVVSTTELIHWVRQHASPVIPVGDREQLTLSTGHMSVRGDLEYIMTILDGMRRSGDESERESSPVFNLMDALEASLRSHRSSA